MLLAYAKFAENGFQQVIGDFLAGDFTECGQSGTQLLGNQFLAESYPQALAGAAQ